MTSRFRTSAIGGFAPLDAAVDVTTSVVDKSVDVATSIIDRVPGSEYLKDSFDVVTGPIGDFVKGPLKDFAGTGIGQIVMRAISVSISMAAYTINPSLGPYVFAWVGPTLAFAAWSIPGLAKGEAFDEALIKEFAYRVAYVVGIFSKEAGDEIAKRLGPVMSEQLVKALDEGKRVVQEKFPGLDSEEVLDYLGLQPETLMESMGLTPQQLAAKLGIREDVAAMAIAWLRRDNATLSSIREWYDPKTGKNTKTAFYAAIKKSQEAKDAAEIASLLTLANADPCQAYLRAAAAGGRREDILPVLKLRCEDRKQQDAMLTGLLQRNPCQAYVESVRLRRLDQPLFKERCVAFKKTPAFSSSQAMMEPDASTKASTIKVALLAGTVLVLGGFAWFKFRRGM